MEQVRIAIAMLVCMVVILCSMTIFANSSYTSDPALRPACCCDICQSDNGFRQTTRTDEGKVPTLAPPRCDSSTADNSLHPLQIGQAVYIRVEADHAEIEVGWAPTDFLGR
ncbi:MAG TPA: hypothetical protein VIH42_01745 [Thermoguttaceae bacterium]